MDARKAFLPWIMIAATLLLVEASPIPSREVWSKSYFTMFAPFLFLGVFWYLREIKEISGTLFISFLLLVLFQFYHQTETHNSFYLKGHFATLAVALFFISWKFRASLKATWLVLLLSDLTYSVYLFHIGYGHQLKQA